jgi:hypothetical protein
MKNTTTYTVILLLMSALLEFNMAPPNSDIGGIGGLAFFDSIKDRPIIRALEYNAYINANKMRPGDLIMEIDKVPVHQKGYGEVLKLVNGKVGTPMSLRILRYNGVEHYYEINRIRVTLDMNPKWWQVPEYKYYGFNQAMEAAIRDINSNGGLTLDKTIDPIIPDKLFYSTIMLKEGYETLFEKNGNKYSWICNLIQVKDRQNAEGLYTLFATRLGAFKLPNTIFEKKFDNKPDSRKVTISVKETGIVSNYGLNISVYLRQEYNEVEKKNLWKVSLEVRK